LQTRITSQEQTTLSIEDGPHPKNTLNDMSGDRFLYFTKCVLSTSYPSVYSYELRKKHGANKPPQLMALLIEFFAKTGMSVLDPFAGVGGTLIGASIATPGARRCVGIEINQRWTDIYTRVLKDNPDLLPQTMIQGDCIKVLDRLLAQENTCLHM
jgi:DNA modification methylase